MSSKTAVKQEVRILVVDDNQGHAETMQEALENVGYTVLTATSGEEAAEKLQVTEFDLVITDLVMKDINGMELLQEAKQMATTPEVIIVTGHATIESAVEAMQKGAFLYLEKPINIKVLRATVEKAVEKLTLQRTNLELREQLDEKFKFEGIIGNSPKMRQVLQKVGAVAPTNTTVLISGDNGTGKEMVAKTIHNNSPRKNRSIITINCAAIPETLLESELFGSVPGAFTGATSRAGKFEAANKGTLFLDEIGDMPMSLQAKLLRVLEEKQITRLGANKPIDVDVRIIAATNQDLETMVEEKSFRQDLYFRLRVFEIYLPPLVERQEDIPILVDHFIREFAEETGKNIKGITQPVKELFFRYEWPGNVRELRATIEAMVVSCQGRELLTEEDVSPRIIKAAEETKMNITPGYTMDEYEREIIRSTLALTKGNRAEAAKILKIGERTLYRKINKYGLNE